MKNYFFVLLFCLLGKTLFCQVNHPKNKQEMIGICDQFMEAFKKGKYADAFNLVKAYTVIQDYKLDTLTETASRQMRGLSLAYGKMLSYEQLPEKTVKTALSRITYLMKFEKLYLKFRFVLYNNGEGWSITKFDYDDDIDDLF